MTNQITTLNDLVKYALGYDRVFDRLDQVSRSMGSSNFPPYNITVDDPKNPSQYVIEIAVAGFSRDEITVKVRDEDGVDYLVIEGTKGTESDENRASYIVKMLAARSFKRVFSLSADAQVNQVSLADGILRIVVDIVRPDPRETEKVIQIN